MIKKMLTAVALSAGLLLSLPSAHAQLPQLPIVGDLLGVDAGLSSPSSLAGLDALLGGAGDLGPLTGSVFAAENLLAALDDLSVLVPSSLGPDILFGFVPSFETLYKEPLNLATSLLDGGTIISSGLIIVPSVPLLSQPLELGALGLPSLDTTLPAGSLPIDLLSPEAVISQLLSTISGATGSLPSLPTP